MVCCGTLCVVYCSTRDKNRCCGTLRLLGCASAQEPPPPQPSAHSKNSIQQKQPAHWTIINDCPMCGFKSVKNASFLHRTAIPGKLISEYVKQMCSSWSIVNSLLVLYGLYLSSIIRYCFSERKFVSFIGNVQGWYSI